MRCLSMTISAMIAFLFCAPTWALAGSLTVNNQSVIPLKIVKQNQQELGTVTPGASVVFKVKEGSQSFSAQRLSGAEYTQRTLSIPAEGGPVWQVQPVEGILEIRNLSSQSTTILLDGTALADVRPNETLKLHGIAPGQRALQAVSKGTVTAHKQADIKANEVYVWRLSQTGMTGSGLSVLRVSNFAGQHVDIYINGLKRIGLFPGESAGIFDLPEGSVELKAHSTKGKEVDQGTLEVGDASTHRWLVLGPEGGRCVLEVVNGLDKELSVCIDGAYCTRAEAGKTIQYDEVLPGPHHFQAYELRGHELIQSAELEIDVGAVYRWVIE